jgi:hypothetical protein
MALGTNKEPGFKDHIVTRRCLLNFSFKPIVACEQKHPATRTPCRVFDLL